MASLLFTYIFTGLHCRLLEKEKNENPALLRVYYGQICCAAMFERGVAVPSLDCLGKAATLLLG